jgi:beta-phosphoglucomutase-like phosphatase (HAD superfamily)
VAERSGEIYKEIIASGKIPPRSGVKRLSEGALGEGWILAVASTSARESVDAVLKHAVGEDIAKRFSLILAGDVVKVKKPAPDIYNMAAAELKISPKKCVAVEDSRNGLLAAIGAAMKCVITVSTYTKRENFEEAAIVLSCLGDSCSERCEILENRSRARPGAIFTAADLEKILER